MGTSGSITGRGKIKSFWKHPWRHVMATSICKPTRELCAPWVLHPHTLYPLWTLRGECWQDHKCPLGGQEDRVLVLQPPALPWHAKEDTAAPLPSERLPAPAGIIPGLGTPGWLPWIRFSIQRNEGNTQLTPPNSMDSITLEDWGLKGVGSQMFHQMWDRANSVKKQRKNPN